MSEKLSNLMDEKISQSELDEFLTTCKNDPEVAERWQRYHIAQDLIKNEVSEKDLQFDVVGKVMAKVKANPNEPIKADSTASNVVEFPAKTTAVKKAWWPMAIAASMLLGLYFIVQQPLQQPTVETQVAEVTTTAPEPDPMSMPHWQTDNAAVEDVLNALLVEHSEFTSVTGMNGLGSYSKFVSYQKL